MECCHDICGDYAVQPLIMPKNPTKCREDVSACYPCLPSCDKPKLLLCERPRAKSPPRPHRDPCEDCCHPHHGGGHHDCSDHGHYHHCRSPRHCSPHRHGSPHRHCSPHRHSSPGRYCSHAVHYNNCTHSSPANCCHQHQHHCRSSSPCCDHAPCASLPDCCPTCCRPICKPVRTKYVIPCYRYEDGRVINQPTVLMRRACEVAVGVRPRRKPPVPPPHIDTEKTHKGNVDCYICERKQNKKYAPGSCDVCYTGIICDYEDVVYAHAIPQPRAAID